MEYKKIATTLEIWRAIREAHKHDMSVFSSYSAPCGDSFGDPSQSVMMTEYGFKGADCPLIGARTTWDYSHSDESSRNNESTEYWFCLPLDDD